MTKKLAVSCGLTALLMVLAAIAAVISHWLVWLFLILAFFLGAYTVKTVSERLADLEKELEAEKEEKSYIKDEASQKIDQESKNTKELISQFYSIVSHSLRIPISVIQGYSELLQGNLITEKSVQQEYLKKICERTEYMNTVLNSLLAESRAQMNMPSMVWKKINVVQLVRQVCDDIRESSEKLGIYIQVRSESNEIYITGDSTQLIRVFYNILENSLKYMKKAGNIVVTLSISLQEQDEKYVFLTFKDDGIGMDDNEVEHIFDINYQGSNGIKGTGMGLYIAKTAIEAHHGRIFAKSSAGNGMAVFVVLPAEEYS